MRNTALLALASLFVAGAVSADDSLPLPTVHVRDSWKYNMTDGFTNDVQGITNYRVVEVTDKEITVKIESNSGAKSSSSIMYFDRSWNMLDNGSVKWEPSASMVFFPATIGQEKRTETRSTNVRTGHAESCLVISKAAAKEKVTVPAGEFDTIRFDTEAECRSGEADGTVFQHSYTYWWSPSVNRFVKHIYAGSANGRVRSKSGMELVEYVPTKQ
jgi:hypothetical protein